MDRIVIVTKPTRLQELIRAVRARVINNDHVHATVNILCRKRLQCLTR